MRILGVKINNESNEINLEKIKRGLIDQKDFIHVVSVNPENVMLAREDTSFKNIIEKADVLINDGIGIVLASQILNNQFVPRLTGVDLMTKTLNLCSKQSLRVLLIGGKSKLAERLADCYNRAYPASQFKGISGFKDIKNPTSEERKTVLSIVADLRPHLMFVAFGSPSQEKWIYQNRASLQGVVCIGVGGAFDFLSGTVRRAPIVIQRIGMEWLYRLLLQPWRLKRQLQLLSFIKLVFMAKIGLLKENNTKYFLKVD